MLGLACFLAVALAAHAQFPVWEGIRCGQLTCQPYEYCSSDTNRCAPCSVVCNTTHHNNDVGLCVKECSGYLFDMRYVRKSQDVAAPVDYSSVQRQAQIALIVSCVALAVLVVILAVVCRGKLTWNYIKQMFKPKNRVKHYPAGLTHHNPHAEMARPKPELKLEIRNPEPPKRQHQPLNVRDLDRRTSHTEESQSVTTPKTNSTALSNRHPAEDTTLDFSYDNMGMNVTPPERPAASHKL